MSRKRKRRSVTEVRAKGAPKERFMFEDRHDLLKVTLRVIDMLRVEDSLILFPHLDEATKLQQMARGWKVVLRAEARLLPEKYYGLLGRIFPAKRAAVETTMCGELNDKFIVKYARYKTLVQSSMYKRRFHVWTRSRQLKTVKKPEKPGLLYVTEIHQSYFIMMNETGCTLRFTPETSEAALPGRYYAVAIDGQMKYVDLSADRDMALYGLEQVCPDDINNIIMDYL